jgi:ParB family chromosome partitioning protein
VNHAREIIEIPCEQIRIGERIRQDLGDLEELANSIAAEGLLQPIGINEDSLLVFGERRLRAVRDILKWPTIAARVVRVSSILAAEHAENEVRKDFTASERVSIARALEEQLGDRRGQRTDLALPQNIAEVAPHVETREIAARRAGFGNRTTYEQAKRVVEKAVEEVVAQMDAGELSISAASLIAEQPPEEQRRIAQLPEAEKRAAVRKLRRKDLPTPDEARRQARQTGMAILDRNLMYQLPVTEEQWPLVEQNYAAMEVLDAVAALARCSHPAQVIAAAIRRLDTPDMNFVERCRRAGAFLTQLNQELNSNDEQ